MLTIIAGKPGSGKTYHMMSLLTDQLTDWVRYENKHGQPFDSTVWTNIVINKDGINETISKRIGKDSDVSHYLNLCEDSFFHDENNVYWWKKFPQKSLIVIDEVHQYISKSIDYGSLDIETELVNFLSTHRHGQQELYFLTQHIDQFAGLILGIADTLLEIVNVKSLHLPFPISISMSDIDELKRAFGIKTQYYQANVGNFRGKAVKWNGATSRHLMSEEIYRVYKSHTKSDESSDRPSLDMSPIEGLIWFARRHAWHLVPKTVLAVSLPFIGIALLDIIPSLLTAATVQKPTTEQAAAKPSPAASVPVPLVSSPQPVSDVTLQKSDSDFEQNLFDLGKSKFSESGKSDDSVIVAIFSDGILLRNGKKYKVGERFTFEGKEETLKCVNIRCGFIRFESGKKVTL
jgi:hypothetical protein